MCGIAGFTFSDSTLGDHAGVIGDMLRSIEHRGPDEQGTVQLENLVLGHNRLTIIEPSGGQQPRIREESGNTLIYNGEIYNHHAFDEHIRSRGGRMRDRCDTETLFWLLELEGIQKTLSMIDGMFAFAWFEAATGTLYLARDRFGQKPLFFADKGGQLIFASEIKSLRRHPALAHAAPDIHALRLYLMMEYVPGPATGIEGIEKLQPGHLLTYRDGRTDVRPYWQASDIDRGSSFDASTAAHELDKRLQNAVQEQLVADVSVGVFLSGGLDSSLIAAIAKRHSDDVASFTVKFPYSSFDESGQAEDMAARIGTRHTTVELNRQNCIEGIESLLKSVDEPFADSSMLPSFLLCRATKEFVTVALGGDGADELFFGYPNFRLHRATPLMALMPRFAGAALRVMAEALPITHNYMSSAFLMRQLSFGIGEPAARQSVYWMASVPPRLQEDLWINGAGIRSEIAKALSEQFQNGQSLSVIEAMQEHFVKYYLADDILQKMDRASMNVSLEVRSPYLSASVADFALSLPVKAHMQGLTGKRILRQVARDYLPEQAVSRPKHGFALPISALLRTDLRDVVKETLLDSTNGMYQLIRYDTVDAWWTQHVTGKRDNGKALLSLLFMAAYFRNQF